MFKKENHSLARINKQLLSHINQWLLLHQDIDSRLITMTISDIETAPDLSQAKLHIIHKDRPDTLERILNKHRHPIHQYLFKNLKIRRVPKIIFKAPTKAQSSVLDIIDEIDSNQ